MRKTIASGTVASAANNSWLDLERLAQVEVTSEDPDHVIEGALRGGDPGGWWASAPGVQTIRLRFDAPRHLERIRLVVDESETTRTQELVLRWYAFGHEKPRHIVRQQFVFSPPGTTREVESYSVDLHDVSAVELEIVPDISGGEGRAKLSEWSLA